MVDLCTYEFKDLNTGKITAKESFTNDYSDYVRIATQHLCVILDYKYKKSDPRKVMETQCQHLTITQRNELLKLLQKSEDLFDGTLSIWKIDPLYFELKEDVKPIFSRPYPGSEGPRENVQKLG